MSEAQNRIVALMNRWVFTIWTPIIVCVVVAPAYWLARSGNLTAAWIATIAVETIGAMLIIAIGVKIWRDQKRPRE